jgi:hypothetical protein
MPKPDAPQNSSDSQNCRNCGAILSNQYCSVCGQRALVRIVSLWEVLRDLADELFFLESRVWKTLGPLFFRPGLLTLDYLAGRRARYVPPVRLYIVLSVIFFVVISVTDTVQIDARQADSDDAQTQTSPALPESPRATLSEQDSDGPIGVIDLDDDEIPDECTIDDDWIVSVPFGTEIREEILATCNKIIADRAAAFKNALADDIPLMMVIFIPLLALSMKFLYPFSRRYYVEHLLFFVHYHAFGFLLLTLLTLSDELAEKFASLEFIHSLFFIAGLTYLFVYLFQAMRRVYAQGRFLTAVKYILLSFCYIFFLSLSFAGTAVYTALTL